MRSWRSRRWCCWAAPRRPRCRVAGAAGHRPGSAGGAARQAFLQTAARARAGPGGGRGLRAGAGGCARAGVRRMPGGPALRRGLHPPVVRRSRRQGHGAGRPRAALVFEPPCAAHVRRRRRNRGAGRGSGGGAAAEPGQRARRAGRAAPGPAAAGRGRQPGRGASRTSRRAGRGRGAAGHSRLPVGHGARSARAGAPAAIAPPAPQCPARGRLRAAGRRALRLPARLRPPCAPQRHADRRQPQRQGSAAQPPTRRGRHRRRRRLRAGAGAASARSVAAERLAGHAARPRRGTRGRNRRAGGPGR